MKVEYRMSLEDYIEINQAHLKHQKWLYLLLWIFSIFLVLTALLYLILSFFQQDFSFIQAIFFIILGIFIHPDLNFGRRRMLVSTWKSHRGMQEPMTLEALEDGIVIESTLFKSHLKWGMYIKWLETKNLFILYQSAQSFNVVPKRAFIQDEDINEFRALLQENIQPQ